MKINLAEISEEGCAYHWSSKTGELNSVLLDLIGKALFETEFFIKHELTGTIQTKLPEQCFRCGIEFTFPVNEKFHRLSFDCATKSPSKPTKFHGFTLMRSRLVGVSNMKHFVSKLLVIA